MAKKKNDKKIPGLEPDFQEILVCRNPKDHPFIEIFTAKPENVFQENLGTIFGVFEITGALEDSSYIVNYLISVMKKEYFSRPKRGPIESFEAALHKANLALSKLASHGNVSWIGHLNAVCAVIEKNNLHISNTGTASALLLRSSSLTNISEGGEEISEPNPLKTFQDVLSGRMENNDKLILTTDSIFEIFSMEEIKRSALKFSQSEFIQFLNTALINEMERASVLVIDMAEKKEEEEIILPEKVSALNAFSQESFQRTPPERTLQQKQDEKKELIEELKVEYQKTKDGFVDKKTGHIYIKDGDTQYDSQTSKLEYVSSAKHKLSSASRNLFSAFQESFGSALGKLKSKRTLKPEIASDSVSNESFHQPPYQSPLTIKEEPVKKPFSFKEKIGPIFEKTVQSLKNSFISIKNVLIYKILTPAYQGAKKLTALLITKYKTRKAASSNLPPTPSYSYLENPTKPKILSFAGNLLPSFSKIKNIFENISLKQKIYAGLAIVALIIIPYFIVRYEKKSEESTPISETAQSIIVPLENDKNVSRVESLNSVYQNKNVLSTVNINGKNFAVSINSIASLEDNKDYPLSQDFENADLVSQMDDLNFIFIIKNKKIASFSASAKKFQNNNISIPEEAEIVSARSYLTYLYILDSKNNQIYRYPRAEGGFGDKTDWLKEKADLSDAKDMAINDNVYITDGKNINKFFRGKKQEYAVEETATPIIPDKLYTKPASENLYVLDKTNSRIIKLDKDGKIISQFYNSEIASAENFSVDEEAGLIYISKSAEIKSFSM